MHTSTDAFRSAGNKETGVQGNFITPAIPAKCLHIYTFIHQHTQSVSHSPSEKKGIFTKYILPKHLSECNLLLDMILENRNVSS